MVRDDSFENNYWITLYTEVDTEVHGSISIKLWNKWANQTDNKTAEYSNSLDGIHCLNCFLFFLQKVSESGSTPVLR